MKKIFTAISVLLPLALCTLGSQASAQTRASQYPKMYSEAPQVLVVMPPQNNSGVTGADNAVLGTIYRCLVEKGYDVVSPMITHDYFIKAGKSASDYGSSLSELKDKFGADACVFTEIKSLSKSYKFTTCAMRMYIRSTKTGDILYDRTLELEQEATKSSVRRYRHSSSILGSVLADAADAARATYKNESSDINYTSRVAAETILEDLRCGKHQSSYGKDGDKDVREQNRSKETIY